MARAGFQGLDAMSERAKSPYRSLARRVGFGKTRFPTSDVPRFSEPESSPPDEEDDPALAPAAIASPRRRRSWIIPLGLTVVVLVGLTRLGYENWPTITTWWEAQKLASRIGSENRFLAEQAAKRLANMGPQGTTVLLEATDSQSAQARAVACKYLPTLGLEPSVVVPAVAKGLGDQVHAVRLAAAETFHSGGELSVMANRDESLREMVVSTLAVNLTDEDSALRIATADALAGFWWERRVGNRRGLTPIPPRQAAGTFAWPVHPPSRGSSGRSIPRQEKS